MDILPIKSPHALRVELAREEFGTIPLSSLTTEQLRAELSSALGLTARHLLHLAAVWRELESRGEDLTALRSGIGAYLPSIAAGTVLPDTVVRFAGQPTLLRAVSALPPSAQRDLLDAGTVPVVVPSPEGYTHRMLPVGALTATQVRQVFADRAIRSTPEQIALLSSPPRAVKLGRPVRRGKVTVDPLAGTVRIGRSSADAIDVIRALAEAGMIEAPAKKLPK